MVPKGAPKAALEIKQRNDAYIKRKMMPFWRHLVDFGRHLRPQLRGKAFPKSSIWAPSRIKNRKNEVQEGVSEKAWFFDWILVGKWEACGPQTIDFTWVLHGYLRIHVFFRKSWKSLKIDAKTGPKMTPKSTFWRSGIRFLRFGRDFWGVRFLMNFRSAKGRQKSEILASEGRLNAF